MYARWHVPSASATPWDGADEESLPPVQRLAMGWQREQCERLHELGGAPDAEFLLGIMSYESLAGIARIGLCKGESP